MTHLKFSKQVTPNCFGTMRNAVPVSEHCHVCAHQPDCLMAGLINDIRCMPDPGAQDELTHEQSITSARATTGGIAMAPGVAEPVPSCVTNTGTVKHVALHRPKPVHVTAVEELVRVEDYRFIAVGLREKYIELSNEELEAEHTSLCEQTFPRHPAPVSYAIVRERYCAASIVMNERGLRPPRFRSSCKGERWQKGVVWPVEMKTMSNDMKIIDLHWLYQKGVCSEVKDYEFRQLFTSHEFDSELATRFVLMNWRTDTRALRVLLLADDEQWQLKKLASSAVNKRWLLVLDQAIEVERQLKNRVCRKRLSPSEICDFKSLWIANQVCESSNQRLIGDVHGWLKGQVPLAPSTLSAKLKRMRRWTATN